MTKSSFRLRAVALAACCGVLLVGCGGGSSDEQMGAEQPPAGPTPEEQLATRQTAQRKAIKDAIDAATTAVQAVNNGSTDTEVAAAKTAIDAIAAALGRAADLPEPEKAAERRTHNTLLGQWEKARDARQMAMDADKAAADKAMMATAKKLFDGISAPTIGSGVAPVEGYRYAAYGTAENANNIGVKNGSETDVFLTEDKEAMVADLHGWKGKRYTAKPNNGGMYEAHVYSDIRPEMGKKFGKPGTDSAATGYEYALNTDGVLSETTTEGTAARVGLPDSVTIVGGTTPVQVSKAGITRFKKPDNLVAVKFKASYHGVMGEFSCTPSGTNVCAAQVATEGFTLGEVVATGTPNLLTGTNNAAWTFKPTNPEARVTAVDTIYASYGWWIHKSEGDKTFTASAFVSDKNEVPNASIGDDLVGTATYMGGAAGKYALHSATGGTNDAGHFTARAMLKATFSSGSGGDTITGTIDKFMGADGQSRDWSVELKEAIISNDGGIARAAAKDTVWTLGGTAAAASGEWSGSLQDSADDDGVPKVGTGTFYTEYGNDGKMVGAFGVNKQ